jgi:hypothetical protein
VEPATLDLVRPDDLFELARESFLAAGLAVAVEHLEKPAVEHRLNRPGWD